MEGLEGNTRRYARLLADAADSVMPEPTVELTQLDVLDVLYQEARPHCLSRPTRNSPVSHALMRV